MSPTRRLAAILSADVSGYSRLTGADEEGTVARLREARATLLDPTVAAHHGRIVKTAGDSMLVEFASVVDAVRSALVVQNGMKARNAGEPTDRQILFRIGIHLGDVLVESDGDLMGDGVNIAARLEGFANPGGICLSEDAWRQVRDRVEAEFIDRGEQNLKNIARPVRVYSYGEADAGQAPVRERVRASANSAPPLSIVVLPFANLSGDAEQDYFADGLTEDLTTELSRMPNAFVIARNTAFTYKGKAADVKAIGRELGVRYALEGSVRRSGSRVRLNCQLIDAGTGAHLWAERFDRELVDLFALQDAVTLELAGVLNVQLVEAEMRRNQSKLDPDALDLVLRARAARNRGASRENNLAARRLFEAALAIDPGNVAALCGLTECIATAVTSLWSEDRERDLADAETNALRALALEPRNAECRFVMGFVRRVQMRFDEAVTEYLASLRDNPNFAAAHNELGWAYNLSGDQPAALRHFEESIRLSPRDPSLFLGYFGIAEVRFELGEYEAALEPVRQAIALNPLFSWPHLLLAGTLAMLDRVDEAHAALAGYFRTNPVASTVAELEANPVSRIMANGMLYGALTRAGMKPG